MVDGGEDGELAHEDEAGAADGDENLAHDDVSDVAVGLAEVDHQAQGESVQGHSDVEQPSVVSSPANGPANEEEKEAGDDGESVVDVSGLGDADVKDNLQERLEVDVPRVVGDLVDHVEETGADDGTVGQELPGHPRRAGQVDLPEAKEDERNKADDDHCNDVSSGPAIGGSCSKVEGQEENDKSTSEENDSDDCSRADR